MIKIAAGINWPATLRAKKPRKILSKIPSTPAGTITAAYAAAGAAVTIRVVKAFMAFSF